MIPPEALSEYKGQEMFYWKKIKKILLFFLVTRDMFIFLLSFFSLLHPCFHQLLFFSFQQNVNKRTKPSFNWNAVGIFVYFTVSNSKNFLFHVTFT